MGRSSKRINRTRVVVRFALVSCGAFLPVGSVAAPAPDDLAYVLPRITANAGLPTRVAMTRNETVNFRDPKTSAGKTANLTAGTTYPLARVEGTKAILKYEYTDTVIAGYRVVDSFKLSTSPEKDLKTVTKEADVPVPLASTDIAGRMIADLEFPPSVTLARDVVLPIVINGREVGKGPVRMGQAVAVVAANEASGHLEVDFKGTQRGMIEIAATDWDSAVAELRRRQGTPSAATPEPTPAPMTEPVTPSPPETAARQPEPAIAPAPVTPAPPPMADAAPTGAPSEPPTPIAASKPGDTAHPAPDDSPKTTVSKAGTAPSVEASRFPDGIGQPTGTGASTGGPLPKRIILIVAIALLAAIGGSIALFLATRPRSRRGKRKTPLPAHMLTRTIAPNVRARSFAAVEPTMRDTLPTAEDPDTPHLQEAPTVKRLRAGETVFGRYTLKRMLGRGGMGVVWEAADGSLDQDVALKFLPDIVCHDPAALEDLKRETRRCLRLTHPNIVRIFDFVSDEESAGIAMELIDGPTLAASRAKQPSGVFSADDLAPWIREMCLALDYAHFDAKVVHRDLKPANLMLTSAGRLKVTDFGVARSVADTVSRTSMGTSTSGTIAFMSPQQAMGEQPTVSDDIYAIGATLFQLLSGTPPFHSGDVFMQLLHKPAPSVMDRRIESSIEGDGVPDHWESVIAACLSKDPAARPASAGEVAAQLGL